MLTSLFSGLSGLNANGTALSVIGNNIANINTVGFKASDVSFEDILGAALPAGQVGQGVSVGSITAAFTQGAFENTSSATDLALSGNGFFVVSDGTRQLYTRSGHFIFDANGNLINSQKMVLQGWLANPAGVIDPTSQPSNLSLGSAISPPQAATSFNLGLNLDAKAADGNTFSPSIDLFDSRGGKVTLTIELKFDATAKQWNWTAKSSDGETTSKGSLKFDANGQLTDLVDEPTIQITKLKSGANDLTLTWDLLDARGHSNGSATSFASASVVNTQTQDGFGAGSLQGVSVDKNGVISGVFSNGQNRTLGQVALADFRSPWGLGNLGEGLYGASRDSGEAAIGPASSGGRGNISSGALELANVDLAREFVKMITAQRGFQANSRVITTTDEVLTEVVNLKR